MKNNFENRFIIYLKSHYNNRDSVVSIDNQLDNFMSNVTDQEEVEWTSVAVERREDDRRSGIDRRQVSGRSITVPDMRSGFDRRSGEDRRKKVRLTITGRAIDI